MYHARRSGKAEVQPGAVLFTAPDAALEGGCAALIYQSAFALTPKESGDVERRGRFELGAGAHVISGRNR